MIYKLQDVHSVANNYLNELRDEKIQKDRMRFRTNIERIASILAYEASKSLHYGSLSVQTPLGQKESHSISDNIVIASVLRAGLPMHYAVLNVFDTADNCFVSAYRKHHKSGEFEIRLEYVASPNLDGKTLILCDPMIASGSSILATLDQLNRYGKPSRIIILGIIGSVQGVETVSKKHPYIDIFIGDIDDELTAKSYIVPGLGDAGDLCFGDKMES
ncbi:MAG: uracil phosphoribosyltransferase [Chitinophagales bacterium]|nr:uracil phosphoribosyltransferase [Chitinophagales bacterium]